MQSEQLIDRLERNAPIIRGLTRGLSPEQAVWKPAPEKWSILEVINHLYDEEREDFRTRLDLLLHHPGQAWPGIDPQGWVVARKYGERDLVRSLDNFAVERETSVRWLRNLRSPNWEHAKEHPVAGKLAAGDLLAAWVAHDFLHIRQLSRLHWEYLSVLATPYSVRYAGQ